VEEKAADETESNWLEEEVVELEDKQGVGAKSEKAGAKDEQG